MDRNRQIIRASAINIVGNIGLAITKGIVGIITGSIAIALDAVNSLADALSSVIAIVGAKLAGKSADHDHPFGYGRVEYFASVVIAALIIATGVTSFFEAIRSLLHSEQPQYSITSLVVVAIAALVKYGLGVFLLRKGKHLGSTSLVGSGTDSFMDGTVSLAIFFAGILYMTTGIQVESLLAAIIAVLIAKSGISLLLETTSKLIGERVDPNIAALVEREVRSVEGVQMASNLLLMDFGPGRITGSVHVTVDGQMTVAEFDAIARKVQSHVHRTNKIVLSGVTPYPVSSASGEAQRVRSEVSRIVWMHENVVELRGLYVDDTTSTVRLDAIAAFADFGGKDFETLHEQIVSKCEQACPGWTFDVRVLPNASE